MNNRSCKRVSRVKVGIFMTLFIIFFYYIINFYSSSVTEQKLLMTLGSDSGLKYTLTPDRKLESLDVLISSKSQRKLNNSPKIQMKKERRDKVIIYNKEIKMIDVNIDNKMIDDNIDNKMINDNSDNTLFKKENKNETKSIFFIEKEKINIHKPKIHEKIQILNKPTLSSTLCETKNLIIIFCMGIAQNVANRNAIRETWGAKNKHYNQKYKVFNTFTYQVIFIIGRTNENNRNLRKVILEEIIEHKDILEVDFQESRYEYSRKFIASLNWINSLQCKTLKFVIRVLDDIFVNLPPIFDWLNAKYITNDKISEIYLGHIVKQDEPIRDIQNPMYTSKEDYPENIFPDYIQSPLYMFSNDVLVCLQNEMNNIPIIPMEDAYIGLLAKKCSFKPIHNEHFVLLGIPDNACHHRKMFFIGNLEPIDVLKVFQNLENFEKSECDDIFEINEL